MKELCETYCQYPAQFLDGGNGQEIREKILRQACISCENFATDVMVLFFGNALREFAESDSNSLDIWFRAFGVDWKVKPAQYRYHMRLVKLGTIYTLYGQHGNV